MIARTALLAALLTASACGSAMRLTIENQGSAVEIQALCGNATYQAFLGSSETVESGATATSYFARVSGRLCPVAVSQTWSVPSLSRAQIHAPLG